MTLVVDTSVVVKWFVDEPGRDASRQILRSRHDLVAPDFVLAEAANVLWRRQRGGDISSDQVDQALSEMPMFFVQLAPASTLILNALGIARELGHSIYDCMFLALVEQLPSASLVTVDDRFITKVRASRYAGHLRPIEDFNPPTDP